MDIIKKRVENVYKVFRNRTFSLVSHSHEDVPDIPTDSLSFRDIMHSARKLESKRELTPDEKIQAIRNIGIASWLGGPRCLHAAGEQLPRLLSMFTSPSENILVKVEVIKSVAVICCLNATFQDMVRAQGLIDEMVAILGVEFETYLELQQWIIYALICIIADNVANQRYLLAMPNIRKAVWRFQTESWFRWGRNEAKHILDMLGLNQARK